MRIPSEKLLFFLTVAVVAVGAVLWIKPWQKAGAPTLSVHETTVRVLEGVVEVFRLDPWGRPREKTTLFPGESFVVHGGPVKRAEQTAGPGPSNLLSPAMSRAASVFRTKAAEFGRGHSPGRRSRLFTEQDFAHFVVREAAPKTRVSDVSVRIGKDGFFGAAKLRGGPLVLPVSGRGRAYLGPDRKLYLDLAELKVGFVPLPAIILRQIENAFDAELAKGTDPIEILDLDYAEGGIHVSYRKI